MSHYRIADHIAWVSHEDLDPSEKPVAYVAALPNGPVLVLDGPACLVWLAVADAGSLAQISAAVATMAEVEAIDVESDVAALLDELVSAGVVRRD